MICRPRGPSRPPAPLGLASVVAVAALVGCGPPPLHPRPLITLHEPTKVLFHDVTVFTAAHPGVDAGQDVLVEGGRIREVRATAPLPAPSDDLLVVEGTGRTLLPGFVDAHTHLTGSGAALWSPVTPSPRHNFEAWLYAGVTTIYDLGGVPDDVKDAVALLDRGEAPGPRVRFTLLHGTGPGAHPIPLAQAVTPFPFHYAVPFVVPQLDDAESAEAFVADVQKGGGHFVKLVYDRLPKDAPRMDPSVLRLAVEAAHRRGLKVFVHIGTAEEAVEACEAGADVIAHGPYRSAVSDEQARRWGSRGCPVIYTLTGWHAIHAMSQGSFEPEPLAREITPPEILDPVTGARARERPESPLYADLEDTVTTWHSAWADNVKKLHAAGVPFLVGTDSPLTGSYPGSSFHTELRLLAEAGIPLEDLLLGATSRAAHVLEDDPEFGTVEVGKVADLVLVEGDPLADITVSQNLVLVLREGRPIDRHRPPSP